MIINTKKLVSESGDNRVTLEDWQNIVNHITYSCRHYTICGVTINDCDIPNIISIFISPMESMNKPPHFTWNNLTFIGCRFSNIQISSIRLKLVGCTFINCSFDNIVFTESCHCFLGSTFIRCYMYNCAVNEGLIASTFDQCTLDLVHFKRCKIFNSTFRSSGLSALMISDCCFIDNFIDSSIRFSNIPMSLSCPSDGAFIGWKILENCDKVPVLAKLQIPTSARRSSAYGTKCRCDKAKVLKITSLDEKTSYTVAYSRFEKKLEYKVGEYVEESEFCTDRYIECAPGIHFFIDKHVALDWAEATK